MNLRSLKPGDTVEVNVRGRVFPATFQGVTAGGMVTIEPPANVSYYTVRKLDVRKRLEKDGS
jgi:hypothetical protein